MLFSQTLGCTAALAAALFNVVHAAPTKFTHVSKRDLKFNYGSDKVRGVNLGGWLVLEPWITPSMFEQWGDSRQVVDEYTLCATLGQDEAKQRLEKHWSSWINQGDIQAIADAGMNHIRVPIGYWSVLPVDGEPFVQGAYDYLGQVIDWAGGAGLQVMIDLHGAPGSQNGFDNSGRYGPIQWTQGDTVDHTLNTLKKLRQDHGDHPAVATIEALNEPLGPNLDMGTVTQFYQDSWGTIVADGHNIAMTIHDAFQGPKYWNGWGDGMNNIIVDTHHYEIFEDSQVSMSVDDHIRTACDFGGDMRASNKWTIAGEWTGGLTDCAKWLNGLGKGARYDGTLSGSSQVGSCDGLSTGTVSGLSDSDKTNIRKFVEAQLDAFESAAGWIFWTWKTESAPEWHMKDLLAAGVFPQPLDDRQYPGQCG